MFKHEPVDLGYTDLTAYTSDTGRVYSTPSGISYPSITTVLSVLSRDQIAKWRARVGEEEANRVSRVASSRGTSIHDMLEAYVGNEEGFLDGKMPHLVQTFHQVKPVLDEHIGTVYAQECALYSDKLGIAGRCDLVAEWDGEIAIIDYKTAKKEKKKEWISAYFMQAAFYAAGWYERTGVPIKKSVIVIAGDEGNQIFEESTFDWLPKLSEAIKLYNEEQK